MVPARPVPVDAGAAAAGGGGSASGSAGAADGLDTVAAGGKTNVDPATPLRGRVHVARWVAAGLTLAVLGLLVNAFANSLIQWHVVGHYLGSPLILAGFRRTVELSLASMLFGLVLGVIFSVMRLSKNPVTSSVAWLYVWLFRGTPVYLQLLIWFNLAFVFARIHIPGVIDKPTVQVITPFVAALLGLGINEGAYLTEIIRGGILSVDLGQEEAATALGFSRRRRLRSVILPQALPAIVPTIGNEAIGMLKTSALAAGISYSELLNASEQIYYQNARIMELLFVAAFWYLVATSVTSIGQFYLERRIGRSLGSYRRRSSAEQLLTRLHGAYVRRRHVDD